MAKIETQKKKIVNIDELKAYRVAYGNDLGTKDYLSFVAAPALLLGGFSFLILYNIWVSLALAIVGGLYGLIFLMPESVRKQYESEGFNQRNRFINNITQVLTDDSQTVLMALQKVTERSDGEFSENLEKFHARLIGANDEMVRESVIWFTDLYDDDIVFVQYIEQLETALLEGRTNIDTLQDIKSYHNQIRQKQEYYEAQKNAHLSDMKRLVVITLILVVMLSVSFGFETYLEAFARSWIGYITAFLYLAIVMNFLRQFGNYLFDDSVTEVRQ